MIKRFYSLVMVLLMGCSGDTAPAPSGLHFLALGDSYTIGEGVESSQTWPAQLADALRQQKIAVADPKIVATTGWTTADLSAAMDQANFTSDYDLVGLLIGVNNQFQGRSQEEYRQQFDTLLHRAITLARGSTKHVFVVSIPDWGVTPFAGQVNADRAEVGKEIDQFNAIAKDLTVTAGVQFIDITPITRHRKDLVADDGLHPSAQMYGLWVQKILPIVMAELGSSPTSAPAPSATMPSTVAPVSSPVGAASTH